MAPPKSKDRIAVTMWGRNWHLLFNILADYICTLIDAREQTFDPTEKEELTSDIRDIVQKLLPILYLAASEEDYSDEDDSMTNKMIYRNLQKDSGFVVPEHNEDAAKTVVVCLDEELKNHQKRMKTLWEKIQKGMDKDE